MSKARIHVDREAIADFCRRHHIRWLALFGSVLRDDFRPDSDVDVLVEYDPEHIPGWTALGQMDDELSALFEGRRIDLVSKKYLNRHLRDRVLSEAQVIYAEG